MAFSWVSHANFLLLAGLSFFAFSATARDAEFERLLAQPAIDPEPGYIPKAVHFVYVDLREVTWMEYAAVKASLELQPTSINLWIPQNAGDPPGPIWEQILSINGTVLRRMEMPDMVFGNPVKVIQHVSDVARLQILHEEGGIYLDTNVVTLRSSDAVLLGNATKSTVMAMEGSTGLCNAVIMTKPRAPFLRRWMQKYYWFRDSDWAGLSVIMPKFMYLIGDPDITVLDDHAWFWPTWDVKNLGLMSMWLGKSWWDIDRSYGVHFMHWQRDVRAWYLSLEPDEVRIIDTPLFCKIRHLFDNVNGDGYVATPPELNSNCSLTWMNSTTPHDNGLFSQYDFAVDSDDRKWVDTSGNNLHGWAPNGTALTREVDNRHVTRRFDEGSYAALPVPTDWDARVGSIHLGFKLDGHNWGVLVNQGGWMQHAIQWWHDTTKHWVLWKVRFGEAGAIDLSLERSNGDNKAPVLRLRWSRATLRHESWSDNLDWRIHDSRLLHLLDSSFHNLTISWDRMQSMRIHVFLDDELIATSSIDHLSTPKIAQEVWLNARDWKSIGSGFRGHVSSVRIYSKPIGPEQAAKDASVRAARLKSSAVLPRGDAPRFGLFMVLCIFILFGSFRRMRSLMHWILRLLRWRPKGQQIMKLV